MIQLKNWRKAQGLSAEAAGKLIGVSRVQWFRMESGARAVAADKVIDIETLTGISRHVLRPDVFGAPSKEVAA